MSEPFIETWRDQASCREVDPELHFPPGGSAAHPAKQVCAGCTVRAECLDDALSWPASEDFGIRGGLSERERVALRRAARLAPVVTLPIPSARDRRAA